MLWVIFIQAALILPLLSPGVLSIGTAYAIGSVFYVGLAIFAENKDMICNAARLNTGVAIGNILLQFLVWSSCQSLSCHVSAAYRAAWFTVAGIVMIILSELFFTWCQRFRHSSFSVINTRFRWTFIHFNILRIRG